MLSRCFYVAKLGDREPLDHAHRPLTVWTEPEDGWGWGGGMNAGRLDRQQGAAERKQRAAAAIGEEAKVADAGKATGQDMLEETP